MSDHPIFSRTRSISLVNLLKDSTKKRDVHGGRRLHAQILVEGLLQKNVYVGCTLLNMYAKCGAFSMAHQVFDDISSKNAACWNVLLSGYIQSGLGDRALCCFQKMISLGNEPDVVTFTCVLKACTLVGAMEKGKEIHDELIRKGLIGQDDLLGTALVDMYVKCGYLFKAQEVFDQLQNPDVVSWTALIAGYSQYGHCKKALHLYYHMQNQGLTPNAMTFACILKACGNIQLVEMGEELYAEIARRNLLTNDIILGNALVDMYAKSGALAKAKCVFDSLLVYNVVSWTALIVGFCQQGLGEEALSCYERMQAESIHPDAVAVSHILEACGIIGALQKGMQIHAGILYQENHLIIVNPMISMYVNCCALDKAQEMFNRLPNPDVISWNSLIAGYTQHDLHQEVLNCFSKMRLNGVPLDAVTCSCIVQTYASMRAYTKGIEMHGEIARMGLIENNCVLGNSMIDMYNMCGAISKAQEVFDMLLVRDIVSWNSLMSGYAHVNEHNMVFKLLDQLEGNGLEPSSVTYIIVLRSCVSLGLVNEGQSFFDNLCLTHGIIESLEHRTIMIDLFSHAGLFDKVAALMPPCDYLPVWFSLLRAAYVWGDLLLGILAFEQVIALDIRFVKAYILMSNIYDAVDMQEDAKRMLAKAQDMLELSAYDVASWNALISAYCEQGHLVEAMKSFTEMEAKGISPNMVTFLCILKACGRGAAASKGEMIYHEIIGRGLWDSNIFGSATISMYGKCGALVKAQELFNELRSHEVVSWTALMTGYCEHGQGTEALHLFERMKCEAVAPDIVTLVCILRACSILGIADRAQLYLETMRISNDFVPNFKHHSCLVGILACPGQFRKIVEMLGSIPYSSHSSCRVALLSACWKRGNEKMGREAFNWRG